MSSPLWLSWASTQNNTRLVGVKHCLFSMFCLLFVWFYSHLQARHGPYMGVELCKWSWLVSQMCRQPSVNKSIWVSCAEEGASNAISLSRPECIIWRDTVTSYIPKSTSSLWPLLIGVGFDLGAIVTDKQYESVTCFSCLWVVSVQAYMLNILAVFVALWWWSQLL